MDFEKVIDGKYADKVEKLSRQRASFRRHKPPPKVVRFRLQTGRAHKGEPGSVGRSARAPTGIGTGGVGLGGLQGDQAAADTLSLHAILQESLWHRFSRLAHETADGTRNGSMVSERYLNAALKAQRAAMACLSALKAIRDGNQATPTTPAPAAVPAPATRTTAT